MQLGWFPVAVVQYTFIHKQYIEKTQLTNWEEWESCLIFMSYTLEFALQLRKKYGNNLSG